MIMNLKGTKLAVTKKSDFYVNIYINFMSAFFKDPG